MKLMAVICEYNPFHFGHAYQLKTHKDSLSADGVVCLMSGSFVQRGAPAVYNKWTRAKTAIMGGADLVLELPVVYAAQSAMRFAAGAVAILNALGCVDFLSFGSECGDIDRLQNAAEIIFSNKFQKSVALEMKKGKSFPAARSAVAKEHFPTVCADLISAPNNILGLEYIGALNRIGSNICPVTLRRSVDFASASQIRERMNNGQDISQFVPYPESCNGKLYDTSVFNHLVSYQFRRETGENLKTIADVAEGLENRLLKCAKTSFGAAELAEQVKTKRYTRTRIDRIIINTLLGITDADTELPPQYARVLGFNHRGRDILNEIGKTADFPIITKLADVKPSGPRFRRMLDKELLATDIYALMTDDKQAGLDFKQSPIYVK